MTEKSIPQELEILKLVCDKLELADIPYMLIPKQHEESGIWQGGCSKFSSESGAERATIAE